ncbi:hypothetical protein GUITHDRAFT_132470 [Guillardia theta CCMP2712]|uniref:C2 domain-containing protein n=1 Tax=Guillardia theta (strain CCMP2712) TaxID=905079 RepID=L1JZM9_GUITC|nr:hypothetical protein GUITHDRAFT_132470 [Guillardia theta CCMP2712]EKX54056.1 hypothetical protein GUITHDRAFT_132470 [Guillardia theta CCMP2712]|eukprot:XP_005841036.1 hypothetical protein GUITHDRAFT_132470 [Guillardia theta CCMP2712]
MMESSVVTVKIHRAEGLLLPSSKDSALAAQACIREVGSDQKPSYGTSLWTQPCPPSSNPWWESQQFELRVRNPQNSQLILSVSDINAANPADRFLGEVILNIHMLTPSRSPIRDKFKLTQSQYFNTAVRGFIEVSICYKPASYPSPRILLQQDSQSIASGASTKPADASTPLSTGTVASKNEDWAWQPDDVKKRCSVRFEDEVMSKKKSVETVQPQQSNLEPIAEVVKCQQTEPEMPWDFVAKLLKLDTIKLPV